MASQYIQLPQQDGSGPAAGVDSFNGRTGVVVSQVGDYSAGTIANTPAGSIAATDVQAAINELDTEKQTTITGAATTITSSNLTANRAVISNASGKVDVSTTTDTELNFVSGVTSAIQTQLNNKQDLDSTLTALAAYNTNGILTQTAPDTFIGRTITGTSSILVTNGDGVSGNPTLALPTSGVTAGSYLNSNVTVNDRGIITAITNGNTMERNPDTQLRIYDDFTGGTPANGAYGFSVTNSGSGAASTTTNFNFANLTGRAIGVMQVSSGTASAARSTVSNFLSAFSTGYCSYDFQSRVTLASTGSVSDQFEATFGFIDNSGAGPHHGDGAYFRFFGEGTNVFWEAVTSASNIRTIVSTSAPVLINNLELFRIFINEAGDLVQFYINNVLVASISTNIPAPNTTQYFGFGFKTTKLAFGTGANISMLVDWVYLAADYSAARG